MKTSTMNDDLPSLLYLITTKYENLVGGERILHSREWSPHMGERAVPRKHEKGLENTWYLQISIYIRKLVIAVSFENIEVSTLENSAEEEIKQRL